MEIWKDVLGYEGYYKISNIGRIKSVERYVNTIRNGKKQKNKLKGKILVINNAGSNYSHIKFSKENKLKRKYIHRLVAESFIENTENKKYVDHINGICTDNRLENLRWVTAKENSNNPNTINNNGKTKFKKFHVPYNKKNINFYLKKPIERYRFKKVCELYNEDFLNFQEEWKGDYRNNRKEKKYVYTIKL